MSDVLRNIASNLSAKSTRDGIDYALGIDERINEITNVYTKKNDREESKTKKTPNTYEIVDGITEDMFGLKREGMQKVEEIDGPYYNSTSTDGYGYATKIVQDTKEQLYQNEKNEEDKTIGE